MISLLGSYRVTTVYPVNNLII